MAIYKAGIVSTAKHNIVLIMVGNTIIDQYFQRERIRELARSFFFATEYVYLVGVNVFGQITYWGVDDDILKFLSFRNINSFKWQIFYD